MRRILLAGGLALLLAGCGSAGPVLRGGVRGADVVEIARDQIGTPYRYGGADPDEGFDCSGLVQYCFKELGVKLPHGTKLLYGQGRAIPKGKLLPGDLVFFNISGSGVSHVGIYSGGDKMIHAPSTGAKVREESMTISYWKKRYLKAKRLD